MKETQSHCSAQQVPHDAYNGSGSELNTQDLDQVNLMSSLDILILASFRTFDGGGISLVEEINTLVLCTVQLGLHPT